MDFQLEILYFIQGLKTPVLDTVFEIITMTGEEIFYILIAAWLLWCKNKDLGHRLGFALLSSTTFNPLLKESLQVQRPIGVEGIDSMRVHTATGYAFPSGHTQGAASFWTGLITAIRKPWIYALGSAMMVLVGISRLYLGVHWPTDVLGGLVIGIVWVLLVNRLFDFSRSGGRQWILLLLVLPLGAAYFIAPSPDHIKSFGTLLGFWLGYRIDEAYLRFQVKEIWYVQIIKILIGLAVLLVLKEGLKPLLLNLGGWGDLIRYSLIGLWLTAGAPALFRLLLSKARHVRDLFEG